MNLLLEMFGCAVDLPVRWRDVTTAVIFVLSLRDKRAPLGAPPDQPGLTMPVNFMGDKPELS
jgi:hypothetical protein